MSRYDEWATHLDPDLEGGEVTDDERRALDRIGATLADATTWEAPPAGLRDRIMAEAAAHTASQPSEPSATVTSLDERRASRWWIPATAVAALAIAVVLFALQAAPNDAIERFDLAGTDLAPNVVATAEVEPLAAGVAITVDIEGLPPAATGEYYAAWLNGPDGTVPIGTFHMRDGIVPIELWSGVDTARYPNLGITIQQESEPTVSSGIVVVRGRVAPEQ